MLVDGRQLASGVKSFLTMFLWIITNISNDIFMKLLREVANALYNIIIGRTILYDPQHPPIIVRYNASQVLLDSTSTSIELN